jgi:hypothetical protein
MFMVQHRRNSLVITAHYELIFLRRRATVQHTGEFTDSDALDKERYYLLFLFQKY